MTYFTFETAWIVARIQNAINEQQKRAARNRLLNSRLYPDWRARGNFRDFEAMCWGLSAEAQEMLAPDGSDPADWGAW